MNATGLFKSTIIFHYRNNNLKDISLSGAIVHMISWSTVHLRLLLFNILEEGLIGLSGSKLWCDLFTAEALAIQD